MSNVSTKFSEHACQLCGCERKLVETLIDDEFYWDDKQKTYQPNQFTDSFEHTGNDRCGDCGEQWSGW